MIPTISPISVLLCAPVCIATAIIAKLVYRFTSAEQFDTSHKAYVKHMSDYLKRKCGEDGFTSTWVLSGTVHVLCRNATIFSGDSPTFIIPSANKCSLDYITFMKSLPMYHDVFCIDLPSWGVSEPLIDVDLRNDPLSDIFKRYATVINDAMTELFPHRGQKFTLMGDAFGAYLLTHALSSGIIPVNSIKKCIMCELPGISADTLRQPYLRGIPMKIGLLDALTNSWFFRHACSAFLYKRTVTLEVLLMLRNFVPNKHGCEMVSRNLLMRAKDMFVPQWDITVKELLPSIKTRVFLIHGIYDTVVSCGHADRLSKEEPSITYVELQSGHDLLSDWKTFAKIFRIIRANNGGHDRSNYSVAKTK